MVTLRHQGPIPRYFRILAVVLMTLVANLPTLTLNASGERRGAVVSGGLSIASDPVGANVFVDGRFAGRTPLSLDSVAIGDHRVLVAKDGYLENSRLVNIAAGQPRNVDVKLTKTSAENSAAAAQVTSTSSGGSKKWLWIGLASAAAVGGGAYYFATRNSAPTGGTISVSPTATGMAGQTSFTFSSTASDKDDDPLTYNWSFGDGSSGTGAAPTKTYSAAGTYSVTLSVSDGKKSAEATGVSVVVGQNLTATWTGGRENLFGCAVNWTLTQTGTNVTGSMTFSGGCSGTLSGVTGTVNPLTHPATVSLISPSYSFTSGGSVFPNLTMGFTGTTAAPGTTMTGSLRLRQTPGTFDQSYPATYNR